MYIVSKEQIVISKEELKALINLAAEDVYDNKDEMLYTDCKYSQVMDIGASISARVQMHLDGRWTFSEERITRYLRCVRAAVKTRDWILERIANDR